LRTFSGRKETGEYPATGGKERDFWPDREVLPARAYSLAA